MGAIRREGLRGQKELPSGCEISLPRKGLERRPESEGRVAGAALAPEQMSQNSLDPDLEPARRSQAFKRELLNGL